MKLQLAIVIGAILVGSIATINMAFLQEDEISVFKSTAGIMGHLTLTATDEDGNIIAYRQTDNVIANNGDDCILEALFGEIISCASNASFTFVHIGTSTGAVFSETSSQLGTQVASTGGSVGVATTAVDGSGAFVTITADFFDVGDTIEEAALRNNILSASDVLALQKFSTITLGANDDLKIEWTITIDA